MKLPPKTELIKTRAHTRARIKTKNEIQKQGKSMSKDGAPKSFNKPKAAIAQKQAWQINTQFFI